MQQASDFFQAGSLGYSPDSTDCCFQGLELRCQNWHVEPLAIEDIHSSYFDDGSMFPPGSIEFDCALLMRGIEHEWHAAADLALSPGLQPELLKVATMSNGC